ncbi:PfkB family carbohydrate kinase [Mesorhizobium sp. M0060]|uniref:PfkB family carbohydrate kinase n=1 Tax=Mesorhizobium sp. M0060 TaxID=2956866 RepID=UPI003336AD98
MLPVLSIGDCLVDTVEIRPGSSERHPGGAGLNLAVGLSRLGLSSGLVARVGADPDGFRLRRYLRDEGVRLFETRTVDPTGVVMSSQLNGEPAYSFAPVMLRRRIAFTDPTITAMADAEAVAVNSFPFDNPGQVAALLEALQRASGLIVVDPNPRRRLIADMAAFRDGAEQAFARSSIAKISDEDADLLYGKTDVEVVARLLSLGIQTVLFTHGSDGAAIHTRDGLEVRVPIAERPDPIVDTMGAGDATLATAIAFILRHGLPRSQTGWRACLEEAMRVAAATCRRAGGGLISLPLA